MRVFYDAVGFVLVRNRAEESIVDHDVVDLFIPS